MTETLEAPPLTKAQKISATIQRKKAERLALALPTHETMAETFSPSSEEPKLNPWPLLKDCGRFFGRIEFGPDGMITSRWTRRIETYIRLPFVMRAAWNPELVVSRIACHRAVARSLDDIFRAIMEKGAHEGLLFGGSMRFDTMDGQLSPSCWGAAVTFDPTCAPPVAVMQEFFAKGWSLDGSAFYAAQL